MPIARPFPTSTQGRNHRPLTPLLASTAISALVEGMIAALILDFDGLILDTETPLIDGWAAVHAEHDSAFDRAAGHRIIGHSGVFFDPWATLPAEIDREALEARFQLVKSDIIATQPILPGIIDLLHHARSLNLPVGVASNSTHDHVDGHLARLGLTHHFSAIACRDDVANPKPHPDVYLEAARRLDIDPAQAIAFEDSVPGHLAAAAAGLTVVVVPNPTTRHDTFPAAKIRLNSLADRRPADLLAELAD